MRCLASFFFLCFQTHEDGWFYFDDEDDKYVLVRMDYLVTESIWEGLWLPNTKNIKMIAEMFEIAEIIDKPTPHI